MKDPSGNRLLLQLWSRAYDALSTADEIVVVGYGLHPADSPARQLLASAMLRNTKVDHIRIVVPGDGAAQWWRFCEVLSREVERVDKRFEDWVQISDFSTAGF